MQRQKFNTLGGLNIQSTWCLEYYSYMYAYVKHCRTTLFR